MRLPNLAINKWSYLFVQCNSSATKRVTIERHVRAINIEEKSARSRDQAPLPNCIEWKARTERLPVLGALMAKHDI